MLHIDTKNKINRNLVIRHGKTSDVEILTEFNLKLAEESEKIALSRETVLNGVRNIINDNSLGFYIVAEFEDDIVASLMVTSEWSDWRDGFFWWIQSVYVLPDFRRLGIYKKLYNHIKSISNDNKKVLGYRLYVEKENLNAIEAYKSLGMEETKYKLFEELNK